MTKREAVRSHHWAGYSLAALLLGMLGTAFGAAAFSIEPIAEFFGLAEGWDEETTEFVSQPETLFWLLLICAQTALWALIAVPAWVLVRTLSRCLSWGFGVLAMTLTILVTGFVVLVGQLRHEELLPHQALKFGVVTATGYFFVALPAVLAVWSVQRAADEALSLPGEGAAWLAAFRKLALVDLPGQDEPTGIEWYLRMRGHLQRAVTILGVVVAAAVLATAGFRNANIAWEKEKAAERAPLAAGSAREEIDADSAFAFERVLIYGLFFTLLIGLLYAPAHLRLRAVGEKLRDAMAPEPKAGGDWAAAYEDRGKLTTLLGLDAGLSGSFGAAAAVFAPFATAIIGTLLER